jgi:ribosomal protein S18 acetylase RimI-like enzyme
MTVVAPPLTFRTIDLATDAELAAAHHRDACVISFGNDRHWEGAERYLRGLAGRIDEFPDGHVLAFLDAQCVGQLELEVPYGKPVGYASLYYVAQPFRGCGYGRMLHQYAARYFRSWEATDARLHVSPTNESAIGFYRAMGYRLTHVESGRRGMWEMTFRVE